MMNLNNEHQTKEVIFKLLCGALDPIDLFLEKFQ